MVGHTLFLDCVAFQFSVLRLFNVELLTDLVKSLTGMTTEELLNKLELITSNIETGFGKKHVRNLLEHLLDFAVVYYVS